jgi:hypothetical protein
METWEGNREAAVQFSVGMVRTPHLYPLPDYRERR